MLLLISAIETWGIFTQIKISPTALLNVLHKTHNRQFTADPPDIVTHLYSQ